MNTSRSVGSASQVTNTSFGRSVHVASHGLALVVRSLTWEQGRMQAYRVPLTMLQSNGCLHVLRVETLTMANKIMQG